VTAGAASHVCGRCGSRKVRRSRPRSLAARLVLSLTPLHRTRCHSCGHRAWSLREPPAPGASDQRELGLPTRPIEARDHEWRRRQLRRVAISVVGAAAFGAVLALLLTR